MTTAGFEAIVREARQALAGVSDSAKREQLRVAYLGRKGKLAAALRELKTLPASQRAVAGKAGNQAKQALTELFAAESPAASGPAGEPIDITLPGITHRRGHYHPVSLVMAEIAKVFEGLGFSLLEGPEVEDDWHNFEALNIPPDHPGRDMQDTFYLAGSLDRRGLHNLLPRTQTTAVTVRGLKNQKPPLRFITLGKVYRNEAEDATHSAAFHQLDGVMIEEKVSFADLKGVLTTGLQQLLGGEVTLRFRPSYFPFTEPSAEIDISMPNIRGGAWLEIAGAGCLHPNVMRNVGIDPNRYQSFAWAWGVERIAMLKYGIQDLRPFTKPDIRILEQF